jgi:hypothetical protein
VPHALAEAATATVPPPLQNLSPTGGDLAALTHAFAEIGFSTTAIIASRSIWAFLPFTNDAPSLAFEGSGTTEPLATLAEFPNLAADLEEMALPWEAPSLLEVPVASGALGGAGLLTSALAVDANVVKAGVQGFFKQLDQLGNVLNRSPAGISVYYWLLAAVAASSALLVVRRQLQRLAGGFVEDAPPLEVGDPLFPWTREGYAGPRERPYA